MMEIFLSPSADRFACVCPASLDIRASNTLLASRSQTRSKGSARVWEAQTPKTAMPGTRASESFGEIEQETAGTAKLISLTLTLQYSNSTQGASNVSTQPSARNSPAPYPQRKDFSTTQAPYRRQNRCGPHPPHCQTPQNGDSFAWSAAAEVA